MHVKRRHTHCTSRFEIPSTVFIRRSGRRINERSRRQLSSSLTHQFPKQAIASPCATRQYFGSCDSRTSTTQNIGKTLLKLILFSFLQMALYFMLNSSTKGDLFISTCEEFRSGKVPKASLPLTRSHSRFADLWRGHLAELVDLACYTPVISALGALAAGVTSSGSQHDTEIKDLLRSHPPNLIILRDTEVFKKPKYYGLHVRKDGLWPFICLHEHYVNTFLATEEGTDEELPFMAIIKTSIDHQLGHWIFTLVSAFIFTIYP